MPLPVLTTALADTDHSAIRWGTGTGYRFDPTVAGDQREIQRRKDAGAEANTAGIACTSRDAQAMRTPVPASRNLRTTGSSTAHRTLAVMPIPVFDTTLYSPIQ
jgi:hypothetical protein